MDLNNTINCVVATVVLIALGLAIFSRSVRKRMEALAEKRTQEAFARQDESRKVLQQIADSQKETNALLRELIDKTDKK